MRKRGRKGQAISPGLSAEGYLPGVGLRESRNSKESKHVQQLLRESVKKSVKNEKRKTKKLPENS